MLERYEGGEQAVLVHVTFVAESAREDLEELKLLVSSAGVNAATVVTGSRSTPDSRLFVGSGKAEEIASAVKATNADVVIFNHALSPSQERNLERVCECRVIDRTDLILDIFAQRARTHEGKLQVELAQLRHKSTRLVHGRDYLQSQKGGVGMRGPGEMQLETDRRLIRERIKKITERLNKVEKQREQGRRSRKRADIPTLALVGYTNAGKSTLFNFLTESDVYAADQLFATLDPTLRKLDLGDIGPVVFADTVGFIRHLPHDLVAAFKATLTETRDADLLLHVIDAADERLAENQYEVDQVLEEIGAAEVPQLLVFNKIDVLAEVEPRIDYDDEGVARAVWMSAETGAGADLLQQALYQRLMPKMVEKAIYLPPAEGKLRSEFYNLQCVQAETVQDNGDMLISVRLPTIEWHKLIKEYGEKLNEYSHKVG
ncbi:ribosome rescue GTPase HflX [Aliidiomarina quisquiliarum]|uniref:ribosome rescue GTPase HflX n=1 Tax=Aliidiomarina quisquiliarum TaxID=2938947 RepID=UPI00208FCEF9|nr:ribosome rescue GTPase HflX [Aliidiomarina quisquiliarum]MCO4322174.1 GTPase HflX [Aliidiomarina quisquiliarum]